MLNMVETQDWARQHMREMENEAQKSRLIQTLRKERQYTGEAYVTLLAPKALGR